MRRITIKELAKMAQTSPAAVSLVLSDKWRKKVRPEVAATVQQLSRKHNFARSVAGRSLAMQRNFRVAICASSSLIDHEVMGVYSFHEQLGIVSAELSKSQYSIDIVRLEDYKDPTCDLGRRLESNCDGVLFLSPTAGMIKNILRTVDMQMPYIVADCNLRSRLLNYVYTDMTSSVQNLICCLARKGHRRIGIVRGESSDERFAQKLTGYKKALAQAGIEYRPEIVFEDYLEDAFLLGHLAGERILALSRPPTALLCTDNSCGVGFIHCLAKNGIGIPDDIDVVGFGDEAMSLFSKPRLTYLKRPVREMARKAVAVLLAWIEGRGEDRPFRYEFKEELVIQETAFLTG